MFRRRARLTAGIAAALVVAGLSLAPGSASAAGGLSATFTKSSDWGTGYEATYRIANAGTQATTGWTLEFDLPASARVTSLWEGTFVQTGSHVTVHNAGWNGTIAPGASVAPGFDVAYTGGFVAPANCLLNGGSCAGGSAPPPAGDTSPPTVPAGLRSTGTTSSSVSLAWTASTDNVGVTGYDVFRDGTPATTVTGTSATVAGLTAGTAYSFAVAARDAAGNSSARSAAVSVTTAAGGTPPPPPPPPGGARKVGYFAQWGIYGRNFTLHTLDAQGMAGKLSTINYAFENVGSDGRCFEANLAGQGDAFADYQKTFDAASSVSGVGCWACPTTAAAGPESARPATACSSPAPPPRAPGRPASRTTRCSRTGRAPGSGTPPPAHSGCTTARTGGRTTTRRSSRRRPRTSSRRASAG